MEAKLKAALGEMNFLILALQTQLETANAKIKSLEAERLNERADASPTPPKPEANKKKGNSESVQGIR